MPNTTIDGLPPPDWQSDCGDVALYRGDCLEILPKIPKGVVDAVVTDPPYGIGFEYSEFIDDRSNLGKFAAAIVAFLPKSARILVFSGPTQIGIYPEPKWVCAITWNTTGSMGFCGFSQWTPILFYGNDVGVGFSSINGELKSDVIPFNGGAGVGFMREEQIDHPCPKPLNIMIRTIQRFSLESETVLDPFMGSGTTGVACVQTGRKFIGIEIDPGYFEIAKQRIQKAIMDRENSFLTPQATAKQEVML